MFILTANYGGGDTNNISFHVAFGTPEQIHITNVIITLIYEPQEL